MSNVIRKYSKGNPNITPKKCNISTEVKNQDTIFSQNVSSSYRKRAEYEIPKSFIVLISGGEKREKDYFILIDKNRDKFPCLKIEFIAEPKKLNPDGLLEIAKSKLEHYKSSETKIAPDDYFLLSDVDHFRNDLIRIKPDCKILGLNLIISNPCFEVWLYYSKRGDKFLGFNIPQNYLKISSALKTFVPTKIEGGCDPRKAIFDIQNNIQNAKTNYLEDSDGIPKLFATQMYILAEKILPYISEGLVLLFNTTPQSKQIR